MEKEAKKNRPITEEVCRQLQLMMAGGADGVEAARLVGISQGRASKIKKANFDLATYRENDRMDRELERKRKEAQAEEQPAEEQVPGQIAMDLTPAEDKKPEAKTAEMSEQVKLMRFQAEMTGKIVKAIEDSAVMLNTKLDRLNDTLSMILRAVRKE